LPRSTLCDWVTQTAQRLEPIVDKMKTDRLIPGKRIFTDYTPVPVLDNEKKGKTHTGRLWTYVGGGEKKPNCAVYEYTSSRSKKSPQKFLAGFKGFLQADAYPGYDALYQSGEIIEIACWAHARRHFMDIIKISQKTGIADEAIDFIGQLYGIKEKAKRLLSNERFYYRRRHSRVILKRFGQWLHNQNNLLPKSPLSGPHRQDNFFTEFKMVPFFTQLHGAAPTLPLSKFAS